MKVLAFYLPQFHTTPENDEWWGKGFTEWTNMKNAEPLFQEHYQPRIPLHKNYYDLANIETMEWQVSLAKNHGIYGFCVYHYWFGNKMLLEKPMELYLKNKKCDLPFCFSWANETWTNAWATDDTKLRKVLIKQVYGEEEEWENHFKYLLKFFEDYRYIKIRNKPLFVIYRPQYVPKLNQRLEYYNKRAIESGFDGIEFIGQDISFHIANNIDKKMFSYQIEYQPGFAMYYDNNSLIKRRYFKYIEKIRNWLKDHNINYYSISKEKITFYDYDDMWERYLNKSVDDTRLIPGAFVDWDNSPRYGKRSKIVLGAKPEKFYEYFKRLLKKAQNEYCSELLFVFAWNEWSEGGYLEPDEKYKFGYLEAIKKAISETNLGE